MTGRQLIELIEKIGPEREIVLRYEYDVDDGDGYMSTRTGEDNEMRITLDGTRIVISRSW